VVVQLTTGFFRFFIISLKAYRREYKLRWWHSSAVARENRSHVIFCKAAISADLPFAAADEISIWVNADHVKRNSISAHLECREHQQQQSLTEQPTLLPLRSVWGV
jgi:hypothetical protein